MRRVLKIAAVLIAVLLVALGAAYVWAQGVARAALDHTWETHAVDFPIPFPLGDDEVAALRRERLAAIATAGDPTFLASGAPTETAPDPLAGVDLAALATERAVARGQHLVESRLGCHACHGKDLGGNVVIDQLPVVGRWVAPNLTTSGRTAAFTAADWDRAVRHGVLPGGKTSTMPSGEFLNLSDRELSDVVAWLRSLPPVRREVPSTELGPVFLSMVAMDAELFAAFRVEHDAPHDAEPPKAEVSPTYGAHLGQVCKGCHAENLTGGTSHGDPEMPPCPNLTPHASGLATWTEADFVRALREGRRPDGSALDPHMPFEAYGKMDDVEIGALWAWLRQLPPLPTGTPAK